MVLPADDSKPKFRIGDSIKEQQKGGPNKTMTGIVGFTGGDKVKSGKNGLDLDSAEHANNRTSDFLDAHLPQLGPTSPHHDQLITIQDSKYLTTGANLKDQGNPEALFIGRSQTLMQSFVYLDQNDAVDKVH